MTAKKQHEFTPLGWLILQNPDQNLCYTISSFKPSSIFFLGPSPVTGPDQSHVTVPGPEATTTKETSPGQSPDHDPSRGQDPGTNK